jgi:tetratricopeptide (TPR) repeat protein
MGFVFNATGGRVWIYVNQNLTLSEWCHVAASYDGSIVKCYLNGDETDSARMTGYAGGRSPLLIGQDGWFDHWIGAIDDVRIYDHGLYEEEIKQLCSRAGELTSSSVLLKLTDGLHEARSIAQKQGAQRTIVFLEKNIADYVLYKEENAEEIGPRHELLASGLYFMLAEAKEAAKAPANEIADAYKQSIFRPFFRRNYVPALLWLFRNVPTDDCTDAVKKSVRNGSTVYDNLNYIAKYFESSENWGAFRLFLDAVLTEVEQPASYAEAIAAGLRKNGMWAKNFLEYAQGKPQLRQYILATCEKRAQEKIEQNKFSRAAEIYRNMADQCRSAEDKATYELKALLCLFERGEYRIVLSKLSSFIRDNETAESVLVQMLLLKARVFMHLKEIERAKATFSELVTAYPHTKEAHEAAFFTGYCGMLQGNYMEAKGTFDRVIKDRPKSTYASKARLCLARIERITK